MTDSEPRGDPDRFYTTYLRTKSISACNDEVTKNAIVANWNDFMSILPGKNHILFGGAVRDWYDDKLPVDIDIFAASENPQEDVRKASGAIHSKYAGWRVFTTIVSGKEQYSDAMQLRVSLQHPTHTIFSFDADVTFNASFGSKFDFDVNTLYVTYPIDFSTTNTLVSKFDMRIGDILQNVRAKQMKRICCRWNYAAATERDEARLGKMLAKGYKDVTEYTCAVASCPAASLSAKKEYVESQSVVSLSQFKRECEDLFHISRVNQVPLPANAKTRVCAEIEVNMAALAALAQHCGGVAMPRITMQSLKMAAKKFAMGHLLTNIKSCMAEVDAFHKKYKDSAKNYDHIKMMWVERSRKSLFDLLKRRPNECAEEMSALARVEAGIACNAVVNKYTLIDDCRIAAMPFHAILQKTKETPFILRDCSVRYGYRTYNADEVIADVTARSESLKFRTESVVKFIGLPLAYVNELFTFLA